MTRLIVLLAILSLTFGAIAGWFDIRHTLRAAENDAFTWVPVEQRQLADTEGLQQRLEDSDHFRGPARLVVEEPEEPIKEDVSGPPPYPKVLATAQLDDDIVVSIRSDEGGILTIKIGETMPGGWRLDSATLSQLNISFGDEHHEIAVFASDKPSQ